MPICRNPTGNRLQPGLRATERAARAVQSLAAGYIGLDFASEVGDLREAQQAALPSMQKDYWAFAHEMTQGDCVLVIRSPFPVSARNRRGRLQLHKEC